MSGYQYYEFRAIDRPLSQRELTELRALSSRAQITPVSFINTYEWPHGKTWLSPDVGKKPKGNALVTGGIFGSHDKRVVCVCRGQLYRRGKPTMNAESTVIVATNAVRFRPLLTHYT